MSSYWDSLEQCQFHYHVWVTREHSPDGVMVWWAEYRKIPVYATGDTREEALVKLCRAGEAYELETHGHGELTPSWDLPPHLFAY